MLGLLLVAAALAILHAPLLEAAGRFLIAADPPERADFALILAGDRRFDVAAELHRQGEIGGVLLFEGSPNRLELAGLMPPGVEVARAALAERGVPEAAVQVIGRADGRGEQARLLADWLEHQPGSTVLVLCGRFSGRKLRYTFSRALGSAASRVRWLPLVDRRFDDSGWWRTEAGLLAFLEGSVGLAYVLLRGEEPGDGELRDPDRWIASRPRATPHPVSRR